MRDTVIMKREYDAQREAEIERLRAALEMVLKNSQDWKAVRDIASKALRH